MSAGLVSAEAPALGLQVAALSLCPHMAFPLCLPVPGILSSSYKDTSQAELKLIHMTSFDLNYFLKGPVSKYNHVGCSGLRCLWSALPGARVFLSNSNRQLTSALPHHPRRLHHRLPPACSPVSPFISPHNRQCAWQPSPCTHTNHGNCHASLRQEPVMSGQIGLTLGKCYLG